MSDNTALTTREQSLEPTASGLRMRPPVDIYENSDELLMLVDVPGVPADGFQLRIEKGHLGIEATQQYADEQSFEPITYARSFELPRGIDTDRVSAQLDAGVLRVSLPKSEEAKPRTIEVKVA